MPKRKIGSTNAKRPVPVIALVKPTLSQGTMVVAALQRRKTTREISARTLPAQTLSNLLWAACGVNRKKGPFGIPGRTAGSASNSQEIEVYAALPAGLYRYDAAAHRLVLAAAGDLRTLAISRGQAPAGANAPLRLIYVADLEKFKTAGFPEPGLYDPVIQKSYYYVDTGLIAQNVYLFAAAHGLAAWFHNCDKAAISKVLGLPDTQRPLFGQTVGYADKE